MSLRSWWQRTVQRGPIHRLPKPFPRDMVAVPVSHVADALKAAGQRIELLEQQVESWKCRAQRAEDQRGRSIAEVAGAQIAAQAATRQVAVLEARCQKLQDTLVARIEADAAHLSELRNEIGQQTKRADAAEAELADIRGSRPL